MAKQRRSPKEHSIDPAAQQMLIRADQLGLTTAFTRADDMVPCNIGGAGMCCKLCGMGPCRLTKEGQTLYSRGYGSASRRLDVPNEGDPLKIPQPGMKYFNSEEEELILERPEDMKIAMEIFGFLLK